VFFFQGGVLADFGKGDAQILDFSSCLRGPPVARRVSGAGERKEDLRFIEFLGTP